MEHKRQIMPSPEQSNAYINGSDKTELSLNLLMKMNIEH